MRSIRAGRQHASAAVPGGSIECSCRVALPARISSEVLGLAPSVVAKPVPRDPSLETAALGSESPVPTRLVSARKDKRLDSIDPGPADNALNAGQPAWPVSGQRSKVKGQWSKVSGQRSVVKGQWSKVRGKGQGQAGVSA
jgi:hypothetical protein